MPVVISSIVTPDDLIGHGWAACDLDDLANLATEYWDVDEGASVTCETNVGTHVPELEDSPCGSLPTIINNV